MSVTLYKIAWYGQPRVTAEEFERVTEHFAIRKNGRRESLKSHYDNWFTSESAAIENRRQRLRVQVRGQANDGLSLGRLMKLLLLFLGITGESK